MAMKKRKVGRPKMPDNLKMVGFSIKVRPVLMEAIESATKGKVRNAEIVKTLEEKYL